MVNGLQKKKMNYGFVLFVLILSLGVFLSACSTGATVPATTDDANQQEDTTPTQEDTASADDVVAADPKNEVEKTDDTIAQVIADGTYEEQLMYDYHDGSETIDVSVTIEGGIVTAASITPVGDTHSVSLKYITGVNEALADLVIGKPIEEVQMPERVSGSSLTTAAFQGYIDGLLVQP